MISPYEQLVGKTNLVIDLCEEVELEIFLSLICEKHLQKNRRGLFIDKGSFTTFVSLVSLGPTFLEPHEFSHD